MTGHTELPGLTGGNPQHFLAALGAAVALEAAGNDVRLWWKEGTFLNPVLSSEASFEEIASSVLKLVKSWGENSSLLAPDLPKSALQLKFSHDKLRELVSAARTMKSGDRFLYSCISEGALPEGDKTVSKPTAFSFTSGTEYFAKHAKNIFERTTADDIEQALAIPNAYKDMGGGMTMRWDASDSAQYALAAYDPSGEKKLTNPGIEAMAIIGFSNIPCFTVNSKTRTQGVRQTNPKSEYKGAEFWWPLWQHPAKLNAIRTLLAHAHYDRSDHYMSCGIMRIFASEIRDLPQGRKSFRFPKVMWDTRHR